MLLKNKYTFVTSNRNVPDVFAPDEPVIFYQICSYSDPTTHRYHMRKIFYDQDNNIKEIKNFYLTPDQANLFYKSKNLFEYKIYPMYNFDLVELPCETMLEKARSELFKCHDDGSKYYSINRCIPDPYSQKTNKLLC